MKKRLLSILCSFGVFFSIGTQSLARPPRETNPTQQSAGPSTDPLPAPLGNHPFIRLEGNYREELENITFPGRDAQRRLLLPQSRNLIDSIGLVQNLLNSMYTRIDENILTCARGEITEDAKEALINETRDSIETANQLALWVVNAIRVHAEFVNSEEPGIEVPEVPDESESMQ